MRCKICGTKISYKYFLTGIGPECANKVTQSNEGPVSNSVVEREAMEFLKSSTTEYIRETEYVTNEKLIDDLMKNRKKPKKNKSAKGKGTERVDPFLDRIAYSKSIENEPLSFSKIARMYQHGVVLPSLIEEIRQAPNPELSEKTLREIMTKAYNNRDKTDD